MDGLEKDYNLHQTTTYNMNNNIPQYIVIQNSTRSLYSSIHSPTSEENHEINNSKSTVLAKIANQTVQKESDNTIHDKNYDKYLISNIEVHNPIENVNNNITQDNIIDNDSSTNIKNNSNNIAKLHNKSQHNTISKIKTGNKTNSSQYSNESSDNLHKDRNNINISNIELPIPQPKLYKIINNNIHHTNKKKSINIINIKQNNNINQTTRSPIIWPGELIKNSWYTTHDNTMNIKPKVSNIIGTSYTHPIHVTTLKEQTVIAS